jgi:undecaprenyl-diphosphatase
MAICPLCLRSMAIYRNAWQRARDFSACLAVHTALDQADMSQLTEHLNAAILGIVEGLTEFLPVSSTGHLILADELMGIGAPDTFETMIQLGAILAVVVLYFEKLWGVAMALPTSNQARQFTAAVLLAFLPSMVLGYLLHDFIKGTLFNPIVVSVTLVVGGVLILLAEKYRPEPVVSDVDDISVLTGLKIGLFQCLAMIPGMSRSGATIIGAMMMGVDRKPAAEFSFFLAIPTMLGVFVYEGWSSREELLAQGGHEMLLIANGFVVSFLTAIVVIKLFIGFVQKLGFAPFAWYRIVVGSLMLAWFATR